MKTKINISLLLASFLLGGLLTLFLGKDLNWDLGDYHFYNPYALFHYRYALDYWPAAMGTYFNPLLDCFSYLLINVMPQRVAGFLLGGMQGITIWLVFRISLLLLPSQSFSIAIALCLALLGAYCPQFICGIGMTLGDLTVGLFVLISVLFCVQELQLERFSFKTLFASGVWFGLGAGLKWTLGFYGVAALMAFFLALQLPFKCRIRLALMWGSAAFLGFLCTSGLWVGFLWSHFHNPFFPYFNGVFHAPGFPELNWHEQRFYPKGILQQIFFPFYFSENGSLTDDIWFRDYRFAIALSLYGLLGLHFLFKQARGKSLQRIDVAETWFLNWIACSYILWEIIFSFMRYAVALEMLIPLVIYLLVYRVISNFMMKSIILVGLGVFLLATMVTAPAERGAWSGDTYFGVHIPQEVLTKKNVTVLMPIQDYNNQSAAPLSLAYLIPFFPEDWRFVGVAFSIHSGKQVLSSDEVIKRISFSNKPYYVLMEKKHLAAFYTMISSYFAGVGKCYTIKIAEGIRRHGPIVCCPLLPLGDGRAEEHAAS